MWMRVIGEFFLAFQFWCNITQGQPGKAGGWVGDLGIQWEKLGWKMTMVREFTTSTGYLDGKCKPTWILPAVLQIWTKKKFIFDHLGRLGRWRTSHLRNWLFRQNGHNWKVVFPWMIPGAAHEVYIGPSSLFWTRFFLYEDYNGEQTTKSTVWFLFTVYIYIIFIYIYTKLDHTNYFLWVCELGWISTHHDAG